MMILIFGVHIILRTRAGRVRYGLCLLMQLRHLSWRHGVWREPRPVPSLRVRLDLSKINQTPYVTQMHAWRSAQTPACGQNPTSAQDHQDLSTPDVLGPFTPSVGLR